MPTAQIRFHQPIGDGYTNPGSRDDLLLYDATSATIITVENVDDAGVTSWQWTIVDKPSGSTAVFASSGNLTSANSTDTFNPDLAGTYLIKLIVNNNIALRDQKGAAVKTAKLNYRIPAATESIEFDNNRGWATATNIALQKLDDGYLATSDAMAIGSSVTGGTSKSVLFIDGSGDLAQDNTNLNYDNSTHKLIVSGHVSVDGYTIDVSAGAEPNQVLGYDGYNFKAINPSAVVINIADLRALPTPVISAASVLVSGYHTAGDYGGGTFYWDALSTEPDNGGIHFLPNGQNPLTSGRWVRLTSQVTFDIRQWGAVGTDNFATDSYDSFAQILAYIDTIFIQPDQQGYEIFIPKGYYRLSQTLTIKRQLTIRGEGFYSLSYLKFDDLLGTIMDGIVIDRDPTIAAGSGTELIDFVVAGNQPYGLINPPIPFLASYDALTNASEHPYTPGSGVVLLTGGRLQRLFIQNFKYDGIHLEANGAANANVSQIYDCDVFNVGRHGIFMAGENANACTIISPNVNATSGYGIFDRSFLGNTWMAGQIAECGANVTDVNAIAINTFFSTPDPAGGYKKSGIFAGSSQGGAYRSDNDGYFWYGADIGIQNPNDPDSDGQTRTSSISCFTYDDANGFFYAGSNKQYVSFAAGGVFKMSQPSFSTRWAASNVGLTDLDVRALSYDDGYLYAGTHTGGVFSSIDQAANWSVSNTGLSNHDVRALAADRSIHGNVYVGTNGGGVFKSTDHGASWTAVNTGLGSLNTRALIVKNDILYAGFDNGTVYTSINGGTTWTLILTAAGGVPITSIAVNPNNNAKLVVGTAGAGAYRSLDTGGTWLQVILYDSYNAQDITTVLSLAIADDDTVYAGVQAWTSSYVTVNPGGVYKSTDDGSTYLATGVGSLRYGGGYWADEPNQFSVFVGCYAESDVNSYIVSPALVLGGVLSQSIAGGAGEYTNLAGATAGVVGANGLAGMPIYAPVYQVVRFFKPEIGADTYTLNQTDRILDCDCSDRSAIVFLPDPVLNKSLVQIIRRIDDTPSTYVDIRSSGHTIDGISDKYLLYPTDCIKVVSDGVEWKTLFRSRPFVPVRAVADLPAPTLEEPGELVYNSTTKQLTVWNGTDWALANPGLTAEISLSEADLSAAVIPTAVAGNNTYGTIFQAVRSGVLVKGIRFYWGSATVTTIRCSLWDNSGTRIAGPIDVGTSAVGIYEIVFNATVSLTAFSNYYASIYDVSISNYYYVSETNATLVTALPSWHNLLLGTGYFRYAACYNAAADGDTWPSTADQTNLYFVEPTFF